MTSVHVQVSKVQLNQFIIVCVLGHGSPRLLPRDSDVLKSHPKTFTNSPNSVCVCVWVWYLDNTIAPLNIDSHHISSKTERMPGAGWKIKPCMGLSASAASVSGNDNTHNATANTAEATSLMLISQTKSTFEEDDLSSSVFGWMDKTCLVDGWRRVRKTAQLTHICE